MFKCVRCNAWKAEYDYKKTAFICTDETCKHEDVVPPKLSNCFRCGKEYTAYTWFHPSGCPHCPCSFVD